LKLDGIAHFVSNEPLGFRFSSLQPRALTVAWLVPAFRVAPPTGYHLEMAAVDRLEGDQAWVRKYSGRDARTEVAGLMPDTKYAFRVQVRGEITG
jgi:hypothetical protein